MTRIESNDGKTVVEKGFRRTAHHHLPFVPAQAVLDKGQPPVNGVFRPFDRRDNFFAAGIANRYLHFSSQICPRSQSRISGSSTRATTSVR